MSLKTFHAIFIVASILLSIGFGVWALNDHQLLTAIGSFMGAAGLGFYEIAFLKKVNV